MNRASADVPLAAVSAAMLLLELYWLRAFAESESGHLASMVVSTAMLGIGAGATAILVRTDAVVRSAKRLRLALLLAFPVATAAAPALVFSLPLEPLLLAWRLAEWGWVLAREVVVAIPFALASAVVTLAFRLDTDRPGSVYAVNLGGSAAGVAAGLVLMVYRPTEDLLRVAVALAAFGAIPAFSGLRARTAFSAAGIALALAVPAAPVLAPTKDLAATLRLPGASILADLPGAPGRWTLVESPALHTLAGLSLLATSAPPRERVVFVRGDSAGAVLEASSLGALAERTAWLPYALRRPSSVLVLGDRSPVEIQAARLAGAARIAAVIPDPRTRTALQGALGTFGGLASVELRGDGERSALARSGERFDLVVIPPDDSLTAASAGLVAALENHVLTREGIDAALGATDRRGVVAVTRWTDAPPRDLPKLVATFVAALSRRGVEDPRAHLAIVRQWDAWTLAASLEPWDREERERLRGFAAALGFDVLAPDPTPGEPQHALPGPPAAPLLDAILSAGDGSVPDDHPLLIEPASDDRPYFHHFLSPLHLGAFVDDLRGGVIPPSEWGDLLLWVSLASAILLGAIAIAAPALLTSGGRRSIRGGGADALLFAALGTAYMLLEISFLHQGTRLFGEAGPSAGVVLLAFLLGSAVGARLLSALGDAATAGTAGALVAVGAAVLAAVSLPALIDAAAAQPPAIRWAFLFVPSFALAVPLGMPFPAGIARAGISCPDRVPSLVAVNAWASVVGAVLATLVAMSFGFRSLGGLAAALYALAAFLLQRQVTAGTR